eukprot:g9095.t1
MLFRLESRFTIQYFRPELEKYRPYCKSDSSLNAHAVWRAATLGGLQQPPVCPFHSNPVQKFRQLLEQRRYHGQSDAIKDVEARLKRYVHMQEGPAEQRQVTVLHFSGPTGVGKTFLSVLLSEALFKYKDQHGEPCGGLKLHMLYSLGAVLAQEQWETTERVLLKPIVEQLAACSKSLILIDDIQHVPSEMLTALKNAFDPRVQTLHSSYVGKTVSTSQAIFVLSSDLENEQRTRLKPDMDKYEAIQAIKEMAVERWGYHEKAEITQWIQVVPFLRLSEFDLLNIVESYLEELQDTIRDFIRIEAAELPYSIEWNGRLFAKKGTREQILKSVDVDFGARAIYNIIITRGHHSVTKLSRRLVKLSQAPGVPTRKNWFGHEIRVVENDITAYVEDHELKLEVEDADSLESAPSSIVPARSENTHQEL